MGLPGKSLMLVLLPLLAACSELQALRDEMLPADGALAQVVDGNSGVHGWLADMSRLRARPPDSLPALLEAREAAFRASPNVKNRMRLVMLLLVDDDAVRDTKRARLLLKGLDPLPANPVDREFVSLQLQLLDGHREYEQKLAVLWKQVTQQNRRIEELEQQLKALTSIEQNIQQREPLPVKEDGN